MSKSTYLKPEYFYNRELSWLSFDYRILGEAQDKTIPLLDRLKFLQLFERCKQHSCRAHRHGKHTWAE